MNASVETPRLWLRPATRDDIIAHGEFYEDDAFRQYLTNKSAHVARRHLLAAFDANAMGLTQGHWSFALAAKADDAPVGLIELWQENRLEATLGGAIRPAYWRAGYWTEAVGALRRHAHDTLGFVSVAAHAVTANVASCRGLEKAGFKRSDTALVAWRSPARDTELATYLSLCPLPQRFVKR